MPGKLAEISDMLPENVYGVQSDYFAKELKMAKLSSSLSGLALEIPHKYNAISASSIRFLYNYCEIQDKTSKFGNNCNSGLQYL